MADLETIKSRVRKLMAVAGDGVASDAEIETAMRLAMKLMDSHNLKRDDITPEQEAKQNAADLEMGRCAGLTNYTWYNQWESTLACAVSELFGSVKCYRSREQGPIRINGMAKTKNGDVCFGMKMYFYGPAAEAKEAAELFEEWARSIATLAQARWGGNCTGSGGQYAAGFATAIYRGVQKVAGERKLAAANPLPQLTGGQNTALTIYTRNELIQRTATRWLEKELGTKLRTGSRSKGYSSGDRGAYSEGLQHGSQSGFGRRQTRRALSSGN